MTGMAMKCRGPQCGSVSDAARGCYRYHYYCSLKTRKNVFSIDFSKPRSTYISWLLLIEGVGWVYHLFVYICCSSGMAALMLYNQSTMPCICKGGISACTICRRYGCILVV